MNLFVARDDVKVAKLNNHLTKEQAVGEESSFEPTSLTAGSVSSKHRPSQ